MLMGRLTIGEILEPGPQAVSLHPVLCCRGPTEEPQVLPEQRELVLCLRPLRVSPSLALPRMGDCLDHWAPLLQSSSWSGTAVLGSDLEQMSVFRADTGWTLLVLNTVLTFPLMLCVRLHVRNSYPHLIEGNPGALRSLLTCRWYFGVLSPSLSVHHL